MLLKDRQEIQGPYRIEGPGERLEEAGEEQEGREGRGKKGREEGTRPNGGFSIDTFMEMYYMTITLVI